MRESANRGMEGRPEFTPTILVVVTSVSAVKGDKS
jgi:hypothetical protein